MLIDARHSPVDIRDNYEICIIGAGPAGIVLALELEPHFSSIALVDGGSEALLAESQDCYKPDTPPSDYPNPHGSRLRMLGGSSNHWENGTGIFDPIDFAERDWVSNSGWPITFDDISRFHRTACQYVGVIDDNYDPAYWSKVRSSLDVAGPLHGLESSVVKNALPATRFYQKYSERLNQSETITLFSNSNIVNIQYDEESAKIKNATFKNSAQYSFEIHAGTFVLCTGGIENARLLLEFDEKNNGFLGRSGDNVGRFFMDHPTVRAASFFPHKALSLDFYSTERVGAVGVGGYFKLSEDSLKKAQGVNMRIFLRPLSALELSDGISSLNLLSESINSGRSPDNLGHHLASVIADLDLVTEKTIRKKFDKSVMVSADQVAGYQILAMTEQTPHRENRVYLGSKRDAYGLRRVKVDYRVTDSDIQMTWNTLSEFARIIASSGRGRVHLQKELQTRIWGSQLGFGHHHMGTTRMAHSARDGVVDENLRLFNTDNFFVLGSSIFPTGSHVPPTTTICAFAVRLAQHLKETYRYDSKL